MSFFEELQRRNVIRVALGYLAAAWLLIQITETLFSMFEIPAVAGQVVVLILAVGFVPALVLTWVFEWTPQGLVRDKGVPDTGAQGRHRRFDRIVMVILAIAVAYFSLDKFVLDPARDAAREKEIASEARSAALIESYEDRSIVVLPFVNMSNDPDNEYFSDGITEELLNLLAKVRDLRVISRSSSFVFKNQAIKATDVAEQLNVNYVLEGSVRKAAQTVRITAQLIDARSDTHVWSDTYDRQFELSDVFKVQDEIATLVVDELKLNLLEHAVAAVNPVAYEAELQVRYLLNLYDPANIERIESLIEDGLREDPDHAPLLWQQRRLTTHKSYMGLIEAEAAERARATILSRLREIDTDSLNWARHRILAANDWVEAGRLVAEAYRKAPTDAEHVENIARFARGLGQHDVAIALGEYLVDRDPLCGRCFFRLGLTYLEAMRFGDAIAPLEKAELLGTGNLDPRFPLGLAHLFMGDPDLALEAFSGVRDERDRALGILLANYDLGDRGKFDEMYPAFWKSADVSQRSWTAAWTGDADSAFENLEIIYAEYPQATRELFKDALFMRVWDDPRWDELMRRVGTSKEDIARIEIDIDLPDVD